MKKKLQAKVCNTVPTIETARVSVKNAPYTRYGVGVQKKNPRKCIGCGQEIRAGDAWRLDASAEDPDGYGRIVTIRHSPRCPNEKARQAFQAELCIGN